MPSAAAKCTPSRCDAPAAAASSTSAADKRTGGCELVQGVPALGVLISLISLGKSFAATISSAVDVDSPATMAAAAAAAATAAASCATVAERALVAAGEAEGAIVRKVAAVEAATGAATAVLAARSALARAADTA